MAVSRLAADDSDAAGAGMGRQSQAMGRQSQADAAAVRKMGIAALGPKPL